MGNGGHHGRQGGRARRPAGAAALRRRDDGQPDHRRRATAVAILRHRARTRSGVAAPFLLLWALGAGRRLLAQPAGRARASRPLADVERALLRRTARKTWRYFETFVTDGRRLAAARQLSGATSGPQLARRTSPTNIGMGLLSDAGGARPRLPDDRGAARAARPHADDPRRARALPRPLPQLVRHRRRCAPLHPRYVSTVDSGNLAGALIALAQGLLELAHAAADAAQRLGRARRHRRTSSPARSATRRAGGRSRDRDVASTGWRGPSPPSAPRRAADRRRSLGRLPALGAASSSALAARPSRPIATTPTTSPSGAAPCVAGGAPALDAAEPPPAIAAGARAGPPRRALADAMQFDFLYDRRRRIFSIGYRLADADGPGRLDGSFYDLLASEARLASFVAIAKGDVPQHHWFHLGRLVTNVDGRATLMSWGGTMFEYLMPLLLMRTFPGTLLDQSCRASVRRQMEYGTPARRAVGHLGVGVRLHRPAPATISTGRSACPASGLKRGLADDLVVAPYATALAAWSIRPAAAENLERLAARRPDGRFGFYEALDYQPRRPRDMDAAIGQPAATRGPRLLRAPPGHVAGRAGQRHLRRRVRHPVPRRSARAGHRAAAAGARAARGHPVGAAAGRGRERRRRRRRCSRSRRFRIAAHHQPAHALSVQRPLHRGADARRRRLQHVARPGGHPAAARTARPTPARTTSTCAIPGRADVWSPTYQPVCQRAGQLRRRPSTSTR